MSLIAAVAMIGVNLTHGQDRNLVAAAALEVEGTTINTNTTSPISSAPEYVIPNPLEQVYVLAGDSWASSWHKHDAAVDTYLLAEAVRRRKIMEQQYGLQERIAVALETLAADGISVEVTVQGGGGGEADPIDVTPIADSVDGLADAIRQVFGVAPEPVE